MVGKYDNFYKNKCICVTGGTGTIGSALVNQLVSLSPKLIRVISNDETSLYYLERKYEGIENMEFISCDIRDKNTILLAFRKIDIVFHAAAMKHVLISETSPFETISTNITGTQNAIEAAIENNIESFVLISTDKAANPTNVMGASKFLAEKITLSANRKTITNTKFSVVRFGNVLGSRGSVIPTWISQILNKQPITVTNWDMVRFIMSIQEAVNLILLTAKEMEGHETFILKMKAVRLKTLYKSLIEILTERNQISEEPEIIYRYRMGEKLIEELMSEEESKFLEEQEFMYVLNHKKIISETNNKPVKFNQIMEISVEEAKEMLYQTSEYLGYGKFEDLAGWK